jgi:anti-sigma-K factor RskA
MSAPAKYTDRVLELLVQRATDSLNASEQIELNRLLAQDKQSDGHQFEQTAAALLLAGVGEEEPMPEGLKSKLMNQAENFALNMATRSAVVSMPLAEPSKGRSRAQARARALPANRWPWIATAAALVIAVAGWWPRMIGGADENQQLAEVLDDQSTVKQEWQRTEDPAAKGVTGEVIWNQATQVGYMRFRGLAANDPQRVQYQLWIFDRSRGDKYPVDGGVFDIPVNQGEVLVPITARLPVGDPAMFAVTLERAGGTVVSEREHIVVLAKVAS